MDINSNREQREQEIGSILEEINIGISCSSETMRLSDEIISLHAAAFALGSRKCMSERKPNSSGRFQISHYNSEAEITTLVEQFNVPPVTILASRNDISWQVRLKGGLDQKLKRLLSRAKPNETGGILIGMINSNRKIIYVTRVLPAPPDSISRPYAFVRGIQDIPDEVSGIHHLSGGMLGYVGEWHTHPAGDSELSSTDKEAIDKIKGNLDHIPLPTHVMIVTKYGLYPYIFSSK